MDIESPRRKARPSPIQVPSSPSSGARIERPIATSTGIISARRKLSLDPTPLTAAPGVIGSEARRKRNSQSHLPPPKSAAANFAQQRGISTVTVRTALPLSPQDATPSPRTGSSNALSDRSAVAPALGSPLKTSGLKSSRTVEVDYLRNEMEKAMRLAGAEGTEGDADVRKDIILCKFYHTPGLTCTSRPCRFVHEFSPGSPVPSPHTASFGAQASDTQQSIEIVEQIPMSGGGSGPGSKHSKEKYRTVNCRDWDAKGECPYGEFCSFLHPVKEVPEVQEEAVPNKAVEGDDAAVNQPAVAGDALSADAAVPPSMGNRPKSFNGSNIIVPDLRWTQDDGLTVSNPATATKPNFRDVAGKLVQTISDSLTGEIDKARASSDITSPATQYASVPPRSAWKLGPPRMLAPSSAVLGVSPDLPISAYTFSTDSPGTPYHEVDTPDAEAEAHGSDSDGPEEAIDPPRSERHEEAVRIHDSQDYTHLRPEFDREPALVLPSYIQPVHDYGAYPWAIERLYPQAVSATWDAILKDPSQIGPQGRDVEEEARKLVAQRLARLVKGGNLPPQEAQAKMNYRTKPCKFYAMGDCPRGDSCSYLHDSSNKGLPAPENKDPKSTNKFPCKFFNTSEGCRAETCPFLHVRVVPFGAPLAVRPRPWRTRPCRHYQTGTCVAGDQCHFAHYRESKAVDAKKVCAFWRSEAGCKLGNSCKFAHVEVEA